MKTRRRAGTRDARHLQLAPFGAVLIATCVTQGCTLEQAASEPITKSEVTPESLPAAHGQPVTEIRGGRDVNSGEPVSSLFPLSTVQIVTTSQKAGCTGVILSSTKILTAAHCLPDDHTVVFFYGSTGARPLAYTPGNALQDSTVGCGDVCLTGEGRVKAVKPDGVTGLGSWIDLTNSGMKDKNGNWADLAMLTLPREIPETIPWQAVAITPASSFSTIKPNVVWAVGTGDENNQPNDKDKMQYVAGDISSANDSLGYLETTDAICDSGDSGGPLFQLASQMSTAHGGLGSLVLVGILTGQNGPIDRFASGIYTSVGFLPNYTWIQQQLATAVPVPAHDNRPPSNNPQLLPGENGSTGGADQRGIFPFPELQMNGSAGH